VDYRRTNLAFTEAHVIVPDRESRKDAPKRLSGKQLITDVLAFNGMDRAQWVGRQSSFELRVPEGAQRVTLAVEVPAGLHFPFPVHAELNHRRLEWSVQGPGPAEFTAPIDPGQSMLSLKMGTDSVVSTPSNQAGVPGQEQAFQVQAIVFSP
jgi:hypothetical protein